MIIKLIYNSFFLFPFQRVYLDGAIHLDWPHVSGGKTKTVSSQYQWKMGKDLIVINVPNKSNRNYKNQTYLQQCFPISISKGVSWWRHPSRLTSRQLRKNQNCVWHLSSVWLEYQWEMGNKRLDSDGCPKYCCPRSHWLTVTINYQHFALGFGSKLIILAKQAKFCIFILW